MTRKEIVLLMDQLKTVFDVVRLVDADVLQLHLCESPFEKRQGDEI